MARKWLLLYHEIRFEYVEENVTTIPKTITSQCIDEKHSQIVSNQSIKNSFEILNKKTLKKIFSLIKILFK